MIIRTKNVEKGFRFITHDATNQCDQIGRFCMVLATNFLAKVAQILGTFWVFLKTIITFKFKLLWQLLKKLVYFLCQHLVQTEEKREK